MPKNNSCFSTLLFINIVIVLISGCHSSFEEIVQTPELQAFCDYFERTGYHPEESQLSRKDTGDFRKVEPTTISEIQVIFTSPPEYKPSRNLRIFKAVNGKVLIKIGIMQFGQKRSNRFLVMAGNDQTRRMIVIGDATISDNSSSLIEGTIRVPDYRRTQHLVLVYREEDGALYSVGTYDIEIVNHDANEEIVYEQMFGKVIVSERNCDNFYPSCLGNVGVEDSCRWFPYEWRTITARSGKPDFSFQISQFSNNGDGTRKLRVWLVADASEIIYGPNGEIPVFESPYCSHGRVEFNAVRWPAHLPQKEGHHRLNYHVGLAPDRCYWGENGERFALPFVQPPYVDALILFK
ncbi:MAG: hypothetical protein GMKNLPBB_02018 [Myxococcota bacterium]|nr:hypothetical protein [Myxococcota bacterium]